MELKHFSFHRLSNSLNAVLGFIQDDVGHLGAWAHTIGASAQQWAQPGVNEGDDGMSTKRIPRAFILIILGNSDSV